MSRHEFRLPGQPDVEVTVGWDNGLQTYFGQVLREHEDDEDEVLFWVGNTPGEISEVEPLARAVAPYLVLDDEVKAALKRDRAGAEPLTDSQLGIISYIVDRERGVRRTQVAATRCGPLRGAFDGLAAAMEGGALNPEAPLFDLSDANVDDFLSVYAGTEPSLPDMERLADWRRRIVHFFAHFKPRRTECGAVLEGHDVEKFLALVHSNDEHFRRADLLRRVDALRLALPHLLAQ